MAVEQLAEEMDRALSVSQPAAEGEGLAMASPSSQDVSTDSTKPALPPSMAVREGGAGRTAEETWAELNKSPLFMTELEENDDITALQALSYEGTALENAADFKERGNECFRVRGYVDAKEFYGKGIAVLAGEERKRARGEATVGPDGTPDSADEVGRQQGMLEALYANRAACHLALDNFRSCWLDGAAALRLNPRNAKACYRSARALLAVDRVAEAAETCARGLAAVAEAEGKTDAVPLRRLATDVDARAAERTARAARDARRARVLAAALAARGIATRATGEAAPGMLGDGSRVALVPDPDDPRSALCFPVLLLYPLRLESDLVQAFYETDSLDHHLARVLPPPWDDAAAPQYPGPTAVACYLETHAGGLLRVGRRAPLLRVLATGKVELVDGLLRIFVVPAARADDWVAYFKTQKAASGP